MSNGAFVKSWSDMRGMIAAELGIQALPHEKQDKIIGDVGEALFDRLTLAIWKRVPPEELAKFVKAGEGESDKADSSDPKKALEFIQQYEQYIPNFGKFIDDEIKAGLQAYKTFMLGAGAIQA